MKPLPQNMMQDCLESYIYKHTSRSQSIYLAILFALLVLFVSLPFVYVDITAQNSGMIRPVNERTEIRALITELIDSVYVVEGVKLLPGDTILSFRTDNLKTRQYLLQQKYDDIRQQLDDLSVLTRGRVPERFLSGVRLQEYRFYLRQKNEMETSLEKARTEYERNRKLYEKEVISTDEYEQYLYALRRAENELASFINSQLNAWKTEQNNLSLSHAELQSSIEQLHKEYELYYITCPVEGTLEQFTGLYGGVSVSAGQTLGVISPDSTLVAEIFVSPRNIGYLYKGMRVNVQVETFNYHEWGTIPGFIKEISSDFYYDSNSKSSYYKVRCMLDSNHLTLRNGRRGDLKKGMNVVAHFMLTRRSLFDLLYQKIDQWINPTQYAA
jgi:multidrug resistance efflux pump